MPRLSELNEVQRNRLLIRPIPVNDDVPWTPPATTVSRGTLALATTAGLHHRDDAPFVKYDQTYRAIDAGVTEQDLLQSQSSIGFDRSLRMRDINVVFPIDRLRELTADHAIGALSGTFYSLVGAQKDSEQTAQTIGARIGPLLRWQGAQFVLITPTCPFCTHTAGALARVLEAQGLSTVILALIREFAVKVRPPRAVFVPFPFGAPCGIPGDRDQQLSVLRTALGTFEADAGPVLVDFGGGGCGARLCWVPCWSRSRTTWRSRLMTASATPPSVSPDETGDGGRWGRRPDFPSPEALKSSVQEKDSHFERVAVALLHR